MHIKFKFYVFRIEMNQFNVKVIILEPGLFQTKLTDPQKVAQIFRSIWERASKEVKEEYGEDYYKFCKFFLKKIN